MKATLVTFGVVPDKAETGYGYIKMGKELPSESDCFTVNQFKEKPDSTTAKTYLASRDYLWNGGMFMFKASTFINAIDAANPEIVKACKAALEKKSTDLDFTRINSEAFSKSPSVSIDHAVMERTDDAVVVPLDAGWSDVGAYEALWNVLSKDTNNNSSRGDIILKDTRNSLAISESRLVCLVGVSNTVVIETHDAILVTNKENAQQLKETVDFLKKQNRKESTEHRQGFRPWGSYDCLDNGSRFQVKRITVKPGQQLSLQMHHHRAEHWVVVSGTAKVRCGNITKLLTENESTFIPLGELHQLSNPGKVDLELIEVQSGSYLGEDDIYRFEDEYGRN